MVPINRHKGKLLGRITEIIPIVAAVPAPARPMSLPSGFTEVDSFVLSDIWDEVRGETDVMRALPSGRFRRLLCEQAILPNRVAERLEDFEAGLRATGLVAVDEILVQSLNDPRKFRVQKVKVRNDCSHINLPYRQKRRQQRAVF